MRIIAGTYRGLSLQSKIPDGTRPTTDMAREAMFNTLLNLFDMENAKVLDLYAGTGAIGLEAISRGASHVTFVELGIKQFHLINENTKLLKIEKEQFQIHKRKVLDFLKHLPEETKFDFIFADPPYKLNEYYDILEIIKEKDLLSENGIIVFEMDQAIQLVSHPSFEILKEKKYGITKFQFLVINPSLTA
ncbi:MAG: 16S rRNA (guanine(966)-N(2))-methyltransferase RsmD [Ignavibacteria bacterium GWF2_33_9]|nr:MAG: 16S rRNA (guanine(966)-N(2))-methyltransferase RsmD [Ignavibacteria bacterium GWF2_33_9]